MATLFGSSKGSSGSGGLPKKPGEPDGPKKKREHRKGQKLKKYSLHDKQKVIDLIEKGYKTCDIVKQLNVPESTVRNIRKNKEKLKATVRVTQKYFGTSEVASHTGRITHELSQRNELLLLTEHFVIVWLKRRLSENVSVDGPQIRECARTYYEKVCKKRNVTSPPPFNASRGWLHRFKRRYDIKHAVCQGEVASADSAASREFPEIARKIIEEGNYTMDQIFNCDETAVYWKKPARSTFIPKGTKQAPGVKLVKDRFTALLTVNASGDFKMKPVIVYKYAKPHSYKNCDMSNLPNCVWYNTKSGYMTSALSVKWFDEVFVPKTKEYCRRKNIDFRVILFLDNAPGHAQFLVDRHPNVQVQFLPPNTTSRLQPLDQELISNVKLYFYAMLHNKMRKETDSMIELKQIDEVSDDEDQADETEGMEQAGETEEGEKKEEGGKTGEAGETEQAAMTVKEFWQKFKIKHAVDLLCVAWGKITMPTIKHAWHPLLPHLKLQQQESERQMQENLVKEATQAARAVPGMDAVTEQDIIQLVGGEQEQTIEEMLDVGEEREEEVLQELPREKEPSTKALSDVLASLVGATESLEGMNFQHCEEAISLLKRATTLVNDKYTSKIKAREQVLITRYLGQRQQEANDQQQQQQATAARGGEAADDRDIDDPDFDFDGFVMDNYHLQRFNQAIQDEDEEDLSEDSYEEAATRS